jgi:predicted dehydrogenase
MLKAARQHSRVVQTGSQQRSEFGANFRIAAEMVRTGKLGRLKAVKVGLPRVNFADRAVPGAKDGPPPAELDYDFWLGPAPQRPYNVNRVHYLFRFFWDYSGGQLTNFGAHDLDIVQWALGMDDSGPVEVAPEAVRFVADRSYEVPETCVLRYRYADGVTVECAQYVKDFPGGCTFEGEHGTIHVTRRQLAVKPEGLLTEKPDDKRYGPGAHAANWLECVKSRQRPAADVAIGHRSATVCHLGNIACRTGRTIRWDPAAETILGDAQAAAMLSRPYRKPWELPALA